MEANSRYIEVVSLSPAPDESDINGRELIQISFDREIDPNSFEGNITVTYSDGGTPLYLWVYDSEVNGGSGKVLSIDSKTDYDYILVDRTPPTCSIILPSSTNDNTVTASLSYSDNIEVAKQELRNDGTLTWTEYTTPQSSLSWTLRNNSGTREVHYKVYDSVGNVSTLVSDTTNFLMPVRVQLTGFRFTVDNEIGYTEQWYWYFEVNGDEAFSRSGSSPYSFGLGRTLPADLTIAASVLFDKNSAIPYTYTSYIDVSSSLGTVAIEGIMVEDDGIIDQKTDTGWFTYLTTNARGLSTSWPKFADPTAYALGDDTLTGISILLKYWSGASYAAPGA